MRLYYHKTDGGAEYLCSNNVKRTDEGSFNSRYIVRIDGNIKEDAELFVNEEKPKKEYFCPKCHNKLTFDKDKVSEEYFGACLRCDEDFYKFEV